MANKKIPLRKCVGCQEMKEKKELIRVIKTPDDEIVLDETGRKNCEPGILTGCILALCKFTFFYNNICCIYFLTVLVRITSCLDTSGYDNLCSFAKILLCKFAKFTECHTSDKVCGLISIMLESAINCQCISCDCCCLFTL